MAPRDTAFILALGRKPRHSLRAPQLTMRFHISAYITHTNRQRARCDDLLDENGDLVRWIALFSDETIAGIPSAFPPPSRASAGNSLNPSTIMSHCIEANSAASTHRDLMKLHRFYKGNRGGKVECLRQRRRKAKARAHLERWGITLFH